MANVSLYIAGVLIALLIMMYSMELSFAKKKEQRVVISLTLFILCISEITILWGLGGECFYNLLRGIF